MDEPLILSDEDISKLSSQERQRKAVLAVAEVMRRYRCQIRTQLVLEAVVNEAEAEKVDPAIATPVTPEEPVAEEPVAEEPKAEEPKAE